MKLTDNDIKSLKTVSLVSGLFTLLVAVLMLSGYLQLRRLDPLDTPALVKLKEQFDRDPANKDLQEQIRSLDLVARKAFFTATWQVRAGSYLMLAGAIIFILAQRLLTTGARPVPEFPGETADEKTIMGIRRQWLLVPAVVIFAGALVVSALMRRNLPQPDKVVTADNVQVVTLAKSSAAETETLNQQPSFAEATEGEARTSQPATSNQQPVTLPPGHSFPFFRGAGSRGFAEGTGYPFEWDGATGRGIIWKVPLKKHGYNSPVIWGDKLWLTGADNAGEEIYCYSVANGSLLWTAAPKNIPGAPASVPETTEDTGLAAPTAAVNNEVVCAIFATGNLVCADHNGKILWAKNIGVPDNHYGHSSSLVIHNNLVIVQFDHNKRASVMAFSIRTGEKVWETVRTGAKISWASPVIARLDGRDQVILNTDPFVAGYDIATGAELWRARGVSAEIGPSVGVNSTMVFAGNEFAKLVAIKPGTADPVWQDNEFTPEVSSLVATENHLFVATSFGGVACYDTKTGKVVWEHYFDYGFYSSPIIAEGRVYLMDLNGVMQIFKAGGAFELIASLSLGEKSVTTPAFAHGRLFIRGTDHLYSIGKN